MISITHSISTSKPHFEEHQIVLWHILIHNQWRPVTGVVITANDEQQLATIRVRDLAGNTQCVTVTYSEIEVRG